jgi:hypothetical protein
MDVRFDASDFDVFGSQMSAAATALPREMQVSMEGAVVAGIDLAQEFAPVETGELRSSIGPLGVPSALRGAYGPSAIHAWMREKGGTIVGNPWLVFLGEGASGHPERDALHAALGRGPEAEAA